MLKNFLIAFALVAATVASYFIGEIFHPFQTVFLILVWGQISCVFMWWVIGIINVIWRDIKGHIDYIIFKKFHITLFKIPRIFLYFSNHKLIQRQFVFNKTCQYDIPQNGINKLCGLSFGWHHKNSARFGWKNLNNAKTTEIYAYMYINGIMQEQKICDININQLYTYYIEYYIANKSNLIINMWVRSNVDIAEGNTNYKKCTYMIQNTLPKWGYALYPYFGGKFTATHKMTFREIFY